jgi:hypothetical protein
MDHAVDVKCSYCGKIVQEHICCPEGHYICDECHNKDALQMIEEIVLNTKSKDPFEIAELMMSCPDLPMLGCHHAYIAAGAFMAAIRNEGSREIDNKQIKEVFQRAGKQAHGGYCGLSGVCGIAPAIGASFAVLTGSKCGSDSEQRITMEAVGRIVRAIAGVTGPSCCKAYVRVALEAAVEYLKQALCISLLARRRAFCIYSNKHPHGCRRSKCPYYQEGL